MRWRRGWPGARPRARAIEGADDVARLLGEEMRLLDYESVRVVCLNTKHMVLAVEEVTRGTLNESLFHPREALRPAIARQAHAIILVHNHPSGNPRPSDADRAGDARDEGGLRR